MTYITSRNVRHLAVWASNREATESGWRIGYYRPICGTRPPDWSDTRRLIIFPESYDEKVVQKAMAKPVCKWCLKELRDLNEAAAL